MGLGAGARSRSLLCRQVVGDRAGRAGVTRPAAAALHCGRPRSFTSVSAGSTSLSEPERKPPRSTATYAKPSCLPSATTSARTPTSARDPRRRPRAARSRRETARGAGESRARGGHPRTVDPAQAIRRDLRAVREPRRQAGELGLVPRRRPSCATAARTSGLVNPASTSGIRAPRSRAAAMPGRTSPRSSRLVPSAIGAPRRAASGVAMSISSVLHSAQRCVGLSAKPGTSSSCDSITWWRAPRPSTAASALASRPPSAPWSARPR